MMKRMKIIKDMTTYEDDEDITDTYLEDLVLYLQILRLFCES